MADDTEFRLARAEETIQVLLGTNLGLVMILRGLIANHPNHEKLRAYLAIDVEHALTSLEQSGLSPRQLEAARELAEEMQCVPQAPDFPA